MTLSVVQIYGFKMPKGSTHVFDDLYELVPSIDEAWEELTDEKACGDCIMNRDIVALEFSSVSDLVCFSWFDYEIEMVGIHDVIQPWREELFEDVNQEFGDEDAVCVLTLWEGRSWRDGEGEYEFEYDYLGVLKDLKRAL